MAKYDELTNRLGRFLLGDKRRGRSALVDVYEGGKRSTEGIPLPLNYKWQLEDKRVGRPSKLTRTLLAQHVGNSATFYYRSSRREGRALLKLDIDAHDGATDALNVAELIEHFYFPNCYHEASTNGRGRHIYLILRFQEQTPRRVVNRHLQRFGVALRDLLAANGHKAKLDPRTLRTFSEWGYVDGKYVAQKMGQLSKIPRPRDLDDMARLEASPIFTPRDLERVVEDYKKLRNERTQKPETTATAPLDDVSDAGDAHDVRQQPPQPLGRFRGCKMDDPRSRSVHAVMALARTLGRLPTLPEARSFYVSSGLATVRVGGDRVQDVSRRDRRLHDAIEHVGKTFDVSKAGNGVNFSALLPLIREHVRPEHYRGIKYAAKLDEIDLAIALHVVERASFDRAEIRDHQWTCGNDRIVGTFRALKREAGETTLNNTCVSRDQKPRGCNRNKAVALKTILVAAGLADVVDESYRVGTKRKSTGGSTLNNTCVSRDQKNDVAEAWDEVGKIIGRAKRIVVGRQHPRRQEWERDYNALAEWVLTGTTRPKQKTQEVVANPLE